MPHGCPRDVVSFCKQNDADGGGDGDADHDRNDDHRTVTDNGEEHPIILISNADPFQPLCVSCCLTLIIPDASFPP